MRACRASTRSAQEVTQVLAIRHLYGYRGDMNVEAIKEAIACLPHDDKISLSAWLNLQTMDDWDKEMERDFSPAGRGMAFYEQAQREIAEGKTRPIEEGFAERQRRLK
jgi:hypothetical protein